MARFMPRVFEEDDVDVDGNEDLDASNDEEVVKEEEEKQKEEAPVVKKSKGKRVEEEELRPEEQGRCQAEQVTLLRPHLQESRY